MNDINQELYVHIGNKISTLRKSHYDNQEVLAKKVGLKRSTISNIEIGRQQITLHLLYRICQIYNVEIYELLPKVTELASKVSLQYDELEEVVDEKQLGDKTKNVLLDLLNN